MFSDVNYGNIDSKAIEKYLEANFTYLDHLSGMAPAMGTSYFIGSDVENMVKLDIFYTDPFIQPAHIEDNIRMATVEEIIAMKIDIVQRGGRKKDFWDLHELLDVCKVEKMLQLHEQRYPYGHDRELILRNFTSFSDADEDFDPVCLKGKYWEFVKEDIVEIVRNYTER